MIRQFSATLVEAIRQNGPVSVFWGGIIEQIAGVFVPSPLIPMSAGFLLVPQNSSFSSALSVIAKKISLPYTLGAVIGASLFYLVALSGGRSLIEKYGKLFGLSLKSIDNFRNKFTRGFKDELVIFFLLTLPVIPVSLISVSCGFLGIAAVEFFLLLFLGILVRSVFLASLGWQLGETYELIIGGLDKIESLLSLAVVGISFLALALLYFKRRKVLGE